jgi:type II secretory pathway component GspD/PulD (secretin)
VDRPGRPVPSEAFTIKVVPLDYARAGELAYTLSSIAPPSVRVVPYNPTNSLIISGIRQRSRRWSSSSSE